MIKLDKKADGYVFIDTRIGTEEAEKDLKKLKQELERGAETAKKSADKIERSFENVDASVASDGLADGFEHEAAAAERTIEELADALPDSYKMSCAKIEKIRSDDAKDQEQKAKEIAYQFELLGQKQEAAAEAAWDVVNAEAGDGSRKVINNLERIGAEAQETGNEIKQGLGGKISSAFGGLADTLQSGILGGLTGMLAGKLTELASAAGRALIEFGKASIELGSDLQEVQNVVDVTFERMADDVNDFAKAAAKAAGLSQTMAKRYVGTFGAMAKSFGFTEKEAYEMSTALTQLAGDVASFYNLSQDEAYTKLKSVFTGETESLKDLGVVMTQTALDAYAMQKGFGKVTAEMTESEKVALRYSFVVDQLSAASGDFVRTQDSWANQTKILSLQWESFQATVGEGLIMALTPPLEFLNNVMMPALSFLGEAFVIAMKPDPVEKLRGFLELLGIEMGKNVESADGMEVSQRELSDAIDATTASVETLSQEYEEARKEAKKSIDKQIGLFDELAEKSEKTSREIVDNWKKQQVALEKYAENMQKAIELGLDEALVKQLSDGSEESMLILNELVTGTDVSIDEINRSFRAVEESKEIVSATMADVQTGMSRRLDEMADEIESEWGDMADTVGEKIYDMQEYIDDLTGKTVYIDVVERNRTGAWFGNSIYDGYTGYSSYTGAAAAAFSVDDAIPYLATGAVIPPNAPFMAVLGDQRNGTNIEAPEDLIRQIFREEFAGMSDDRTAELLRELISVVENISVGDETIGRAAARYNRRASRAGGY